MPSQEQEFQNYLKQRLAKSQDFSTFSPESYTNVLDEVAAIRNEIKLLREALIDVPSIIATGKEVLEEFKKLNRS